ncbi:MAG: cytochrome P450 [Actinomycetota bacterium]
MATASPPSVGVSRLMALRALRSDPIGWLERAAAVGDVVALPTPRFPAYVVNHPDLVWDVLATGNHDFMKGPTMQAAKRLLGESLLTSEGDVHRRRRRLIQPIFHHERIAAYATDMVAHAERASHRWAAGEWIEMHHEMARLTLAIVGRTLFDTDVEAGDAQDVSRALTDVLAQFNRVFSPFLPIAERLPLPSTRRFARARDVFDRTIYSMIERRRADGADGMDLLSHLLRASDEGSGMTDVQVRDEAITLFLAGHETTSNALTWTWYLLSQHADVESALHAELNAVLSGRAPTVADVASLPVTRAILSESMRLYPPAWAMGRRALADHSLDRYVLPRGSVIVVSPWLLHHDERWWPEPGTFRLERWSEEAISARPRHAFLPFGGGPRMCIGEGFARLEAELLIATIGQRWRFELDPAQEIALQPGVTLRPRYGMRMRAVGRRR